MRAGSNSHADSRPGARQERAAGVAHRIRQVPRATALRYVPSPVPFPSPMHPRSEIRLVRHVLPCNVHPFTLTNRTPSSLHPSLPSPTCGGRARAKTCIARLSLPPPRTPPYSCGACAPSSAASPHTSLLLWDGDVIHSSHDFPYGFLVRGVHKKIARCPRRDEFLLEIKDRRIRATKKSRLGEKFALKSPNLIG